MQRGVGRSFAAVLMAVGMAICMSWSAENHSPIGTEAAQLCIAADTPVSLPGLSNVVRYPGDLLSGGHPVGTSSFELLRRLGVRTIISEDGAVPNIKDARAAGLKYIHLPIGYNRIDPARALELARACRDAKSRGGVYMHCHQGRHRSAAAAAVAAVLLGWGRLDDVMERMKVSGASPHYAGLYQSVSSATEVSQEAIDGIPPDFPEVSQPESLTHIMVEMNAVIEHLELIESNSWSTPEAHPDLVPAAEAGHLVDLYRSVLDVDGEDAWASDWEALRQSGEKAAKQLEDMLLGEASASASISAQMRLVHDNCLACHRQFRD